MAAGEEPTEAPDAEAVAASELRTQLEELAASVDDPEERRAVRRVLGLVDDLPAETSEGIQKFTTRDIAEAFVGSILVSLPLLVEDGVFEIAAYLVSDPWLFAINVAFLFGMTVGLLYVADFREITISRPLFGIIPRRLLSVLVVSLLTATFTMTLWGRLEGWSDPTVAISRIAVVWTVSAFGAALGDILPGESSARDINDELDDLGERVGIGDEEGLF